MSQAKRVKLLTYVLLVLSLAGLALSYLSLDHHITQIVAKKLGIEVAPSFCNIGGDFNCDAVNASVYSHLLGVPVASYGLFFYICFTLLTLVSLSEQYLSKDQKLGQYLLFSIIGCAVSVGLFLISKSLIGKLCPLCLGVYLVNVVTLLVVLFWGGFSGAIERIGNAVGDIFKLPNLILGRISGVSSSAVTLSRFIAVSLLLSISVIYLLEDHIIVKLLNSAGGGALSSQDQAANPIAKESAKIPLDLDDGILMDYWKGSKGSKFQIVEFADFECPACRQFHLMLSDLIDQYNDKITVVFKNYPLDQACNPVIKGKMHENSCFAAEYARCAGEQGKFWEVADYLFFLQEEELSPQEYREKISQATVVLSLDHVAIEDCLKSGRQLEKIKADVSLGSSLEIQGTPAVWLNGKLLPNLKIDEIKRLLDGLAQRS